MPIVRAKKTNLATIKASDKKSWKIQISYFGFSGAKINVKCASGYSTEECAFVAVGAVVVVDAR